MDSAEVMRIVADVETPMVPLWTRNRNIEAYLSGFWDVEETLPADLLTVSSVTSHDYLYDLVRRKRRISRPMQLHCQAISKYEKDAKRADVYEEVKAGQIADMGFNQGGWMQDALQTMVLTRVYVPVWTEWTQWSPPLRRPQETNSDYNQRCDESRATFNPWRATIDPVDACAFLEYRHEVTLGVRNLRVPYIEFLQRYAERDKQQVLTRKEERALLSQIAGEQFSHVALGEPESEWGLDKFGGRTIDLKFVDNRREMSGFVQGINNDGSPDNTWHEVFSMKNPLGQCSLDIVTGFYNPTAPFAYRFNPGDLPSISAYRTRDSLRSLLTSMMYASVKNNIVEAGDAAAAAWLKIDDRTRQTIMDALHIPGDGEMIISLGRLVSGVNPDAVKLIQDVLAGVENDIQRMRPSAGVNAGPQDEIMTGNTATVIMASLQAEEDGYAPMLNAIGDMLVHKLKGIDHAECYALNPWYQHGQSQPYDHKVTRVTSGAEEVYQKVIKAGTKYAIGPADIDFPKRVEIKTFSTDERAKAIRRQNAMALYYAPDGKHFISPDQLLEELGYTNVSDQKAKLNKAEVLQNESANRLQEAADRASRYLETRFGLQPLAIPQPLIDAGGAGDAGSPAAPQGGGGQHMTAPVIPEAQAQVQGQGV